MSWIVDKALRARILKSGVFLSCMLLLLTAQGCGEANTFVFNKAEEMINGHRVIIRPCRESYTRTKLDGPTNSHHIFGCGETVKVEIRNEELTVNGKSYGTLNSQDSIEVKSGKVFINKKEAVEVAKK